MDRWLLSFILGAILSLFSPIVPALFYQLLLFGLILLFISVKSYRIILSFLFGFFWLLSNAHDYHNIWQHNQLINEQIFNTSIVVEGEIVDFPDEKNNTTRFIFLVEKLNDQNVNQPFLVRLRWDNSETKTQEGQRWQFTIRMKPAHGYANPAGFNYQTWLISQKIIATGYVVQSSKANYMSESIGLRAQFYQQFVSVLQHDPVFNEPLLPLVLALSFAEKSQFNDELWQVIQATGTQHLFAISGLHLGLVAVFSFYSVLVFFRCLPFKWLPSYCQAILMRFNIRKFALVFSVFISLFYAYLADFSVPTVRAIIMLSIFVLAKLFSIQLTIVRWMLLSISLIIIITPFSLLTPGFWLSCYAVIVIFFIVWRFQSSFSYQSRQAQRITNASIGSGIEYAKRCLHYLKTLAILQVWLVVLLLPLTLLFFQQWSVVAFVANLIALPVASFIIIPLCLIAVVFVFISPLLSTFLVKTVLWVFSYLWEFMTFLADLSWANHSVSVNQAMIVSFFGVMILITLWLPLQVMVKHYVKISVLVVGGMIVSQLVSLEQNRPNQWQVAVLDVGHGLAVVIQKNDQAILYDTGASYPSGFNLADAVILPFLQSKGITRLDYVFVSHDDNDHAGAIAPLLSSIDVDNLVINNKNIEMFARKIQPAIKIATCISPSQWQWQSLTFRVLSPDRYLGDHNDDSCVLHISDGIHQVFLSGDISQSVEKRLAKLFPAINADVVIAPHHGSKTSSSVEFIRWLQPEVAIFSTAFMNRWKMPNPLVISRYQQESTRLFNTAISGMIEINIADDKLDVVQYRQDMWPFWFAN